MSFVGTQEHFIHQLLYAFYPVEEEKTTREILFVFFYGLASGRVFEQILFW